MQAGLRHLLSSWVTAALEQGCQQTLCCLVLRGAVVQTRTSVLARKAQRIQQRLGARVHRDRFSLPADPGVGSARGCRHKMSPSWRLNQLTIADWNLYVYTGIFIYLFIYLFIWFFETGFLYGFGGCPGTSSCRPGWSGTHRDPPASASRVLGLKACATTARLHWDF